MNNNTKENYEKMDNDDFDGEINVRELVQDFLKCSTIPLLYMTEDIRKGVDFYPRAVRFIGMAIAWDVLDIVKKR